MNRLVYDIPHLEMGKQMKPRTPVTQIFREAMGEPCEQERQKNGKHTVQKPFDFETAKRAKINQGTENEENEYSNMSHGGGPAASQQPHEPLCLEV